jgi:predicted permease
MELLMTQFRQILRRLGRAPIFTAVTLLTLAVSIGATTGIFSIVESVLLKPLPYPQSEELVSLKYTTQGNAFKNAYVSTPDYFIFREQNGVFQDVGFYGRGNKGVGDSVNVTGQGEPEHVQALLATDGLLPILGVKPLLGRLFTQADDSPGGADTAILTYGYWNRKFGGAPSVIGSTIEVDGKSHAIVGVLPAAFRFLDQANLDLIIPLKFDRNKALLGDWLYGGIARLKPGVTLAQANADVARMIPIVNRSFPPPPGVSQKTIEDVNLAPSLRPLKQEVVGDVGKVLWVLMGGLALLLVIACANLANFLVVRAEGRRQELAVRVALGANRGRIAGELFYESLILAVFGGLLGLGMSYWALRGLVAMAPPGLPRLHEIGIDGYVVLFTLAVSVAASLLFGSVAVLRYSGADFGAGLRAGERSMSESRERHRSRNALVIVQVALALVLLVSSGLMIRTFRALTQVNPGFVAPSELQTLSVAIREGQVKDHEGVFRIQEEILRKLGTIPSVSSVGLSRNIPMQGVGWKGLVFVKDHVPARGEVPLNRYEFVAPGFFKTLGTPLLAGRDFTWDDIYNKVPVAVVSEKYARQYWRDPLNAIGKQLRANPSDDWREVIGVVGDVRHEGVDKEPITTVYWPILNFKFLGAPGFQARRDVFFTIRSPRAGSESLINETRQAVLSVAPYLPVAEAQTLNYYYTRSMARTSFTLVMLGFAGGMALFLGIVGLYGVIAYSVLQRRREIGIRMAMGAEKSEILKMVISQGIKLVSIGVGIGLAGALGLTRFLSGLLYGVEPSDPLTLVAVSATLIAVAILASYLPARHATKVDPLTALRHE